MSTRLPGAKYRHVFDRGRSIKGRLVVAWLVQDAFADQQAGVVVSKKTFHDAVERNRAKRLMREAYRLLVKSGEAPRAASWIFIARHSIGGKRCADVMEDMRKVFVVCNEQN